MADKKTSPIQFDDFVGAVHSDPAAAEPSFLLSGFVGRSETEGSIRVYPDASLGHWYDIAQDDVVHARPQTDSPLGGSHIWVKASARLTPGAPAIAQPEGGEGGEGPEGGTPGPDTGVFNPLTTIHPTLWTQVGCPTIHMGCGPGTIHPTLLTQIYCPTGIACPTHQFGCPDTLTCGQGPGGAAQHISLPGCVHTGTCQNTTATVCTRYGCDPGAAQHISLPGCVHTGTCQNTTATVCTRYGCDPGAAQHISLPGCVHTGTCQPGQPHAAAMQAPLSAPPNCPTVGPQCHPFLSAPPHCPTVQQCQPLLSAPPNCPTVQQCHHLMSAPPNCPTVQQCHHLLSAPPNCPTVQQCNHLLSAPPNCPTVQQCQPLLSAPPHCPTVQQCHMVSQAGHCPTVGAQCGGDPAANQMTIALCTWHGCPTVGGCNVALSPTASVMTLCSGCGHTHMPGCPDTRTCAPQQQQQQAIFTWPPMCPMTGPVFCPPSVGCHG